MVAMGAAARAQPGAPTRDYLELLNLDLDPRQSPAAFLA
jgi:hypothetical protein